MGRCAGLALAVAWWAIAVSPALAQEIVMSGSRYSAPLWVWITAIAVAAGLSLAGLAVGFWFLRKRAGIKASE